MAQIHWKSAFELAALIRERELKPSELMEATLARIEALNPKLNAFCAMRAERPACRVGLQPLFAERRTEC